MEDDLEEPSLQTQIILSVGGSIIGIGGAVLTFFIATNLLGLGRGTQSLLGGFRILVVLGYAIMVVPFAVLGEYWWSSWRRKPFKPKHIIPTSILLGAVLMLMAFLSYIFELLLPNLEVSAQAPVLGMSIALAILISTLIAKTSRVRERLKRMYD
jgi:hypothetical protein